MNKRAFNALRKVAADVVCDDRRPVLPNGNKPPQMTNLIGEPASIQDKYIRRFDGDLVKIGKYLSKPHVQNKMNAAFRQAAKQDGINFRRALYESATPAEVEAYRNRLLADDPEILEGESDEVNAAARDFLRAVGTSSFNRYKEEVRRGKAPTYRRGPMPKLPKLLKKHKPALDIMSNLFVHNTTDNKYSDIG